MALLMRESTRPGNICVLALEGSVDMGNVDELTVKLKDIRGRKEQKLIVEMSAIESFSSAGWGSLVEAQFGLKKTGGEMLLCGLQEAQARVFELMGLEASFLPPFLGIAEAEQHFTEGK